MQHGYGLTNVVSRPTSGMSDLDSEDFLRGRRQLRRKMARYTPKVVALVGVSLFGKVFPASRRTRPTGLQEVQLATSEVFLLPNPSGRNAHFTYRQMLQCFVALRRHLLT